ncbi:hypothetical protein [Rhodococcus sp. USK13]|uniref:hypothetical protein n=1 Tax=Rhodococcus sp. USK13 TaxID=2806442 RepID=UPI001BCEC734|nr:hypothetical protein [Rhodococcus sp. USK13]
MVNKSANTFEAASRSLRLTVTPALGGSNSLAAEQVRVITGVLDFYRDRAQYEYPRKLYEFRTYRVLAECLSCYDVEHGARVRLADVLEEAYAAEQVAIPEYGLLDRVTDSLTRAISDFVRSAHTSDSGIFAEVSRLVLDHSRPLVEMQRSWFLPQGVDPDPDAVPPLSSLLGTPIATNSAH